jgi:hypothetical protein
VPTPFVFAITDQVRIVQVRAQWSYSRSSGGESSWSFIRPAADTNAQQTTRTAWLTYLQDLFCAQRPFGWRLDRVLYEDRWPHTAAVYVDDVRLDSIPYTSEPGGPPQSTPVISWRTDNTGRQNRGRTYMGPYVLSSYDAENVIDPALSAVYDFAESMQGHLMATATPDRPRLAIVSRIPTDPDWPAGHYSLPTTYYFLERWGVVRRRMGYDWRT